VFAIGSTLFLVPAVASLSSEADWIGVTFFCGSVFFTSASLVQLVVSSEVPHGRPLGPAWSRRRPRSWLGPRADWVSSVVQFPGTLFFNVNTFTAMNDALSTRQANVRIWVPDVVGSACFLLSSLVAFANTEHEWLSWRPGDLDWWIAGLNLLGSVAFGFSALASVFDPATGEVANARLSAGGTAVGALCFLIAAVLLLPESARRERAAQTA
jgi:hypothetical protein